jgi:hypothetical protein
MGRMHVPIDRAGCFGALEPLHLQCKDRCCLISSLDLQFELENLPCCGARTRNLSSRRSGPTVVPLDFLQCCLKVDNEKSGSERMVPIPAEAEVTSGDTDD